MLIVRLRRAATGLRQHGTWLLLEFVVVVAGLTLSLYLQDRAQAAQRAAVERQLLAALHADITADVVLMERMLRGLDAMLDKHDLLLDPERRAAAPAPELDRAVDSLISYFAFGPRDITYRTLDATAITGSRHSEVFRRVIGLYTRPYRDAVEWSEINRHFVLQRMIPFLDEHAPYVERAASPIDPAGLHQILPTMTEDARFLNHINTGRAYKTGLELTLSAARDAATELLGQLESFTAQP